MFFECPLLRASLCRLVQMHHPIQMKPADSEKNNGESLVVILQYTHYPLMSSYLIKGKNISSVK